MVMSSYTGWPFSIGMVIVSGVVGAWLAKQSYRGVISKISERAGQGRMSADLLTDGAMIFFAGGLLLTPGFITDIFGFSLLIPVCRRWYKSWITNWFKKNVNVEMVSMPDSRRQNDPNTVDGSVVKKETFDQFESTPDRITQQ